MTNKELVKDLVQQREEAREWGNKQRDRANAAENKNERLRYVMKESIKLLAFLLEEA